MQKLQVEFNNVPRNASLVPCSTSLQLNRDQSLSVVSKVLTCNNPEVNLPEYTQGLKANYVYVDRGAKAPLSFSNKELVSSIELKTQWFSPEGYINENNIILHWNYYFRSIYYFLNSFFWIYHL